MKTNIETEVQECRVQSRCALYSFCALHSALCTLAVLLIAAAPAAAPDDEFRKAEEVFSKDPPSQTVVDRLYDFMSKYPKDPRSDMLQYWVALTQQRRKYHNEAIKEFAFVLNDFPKSPLRIVALKAQADSYFAIDQPDKALENFRAIVPLKPRDFSTDPRATNAFRHAISVLADHHVRQRQLDQAVELLIQLPDQTEAVTRIVRIYLDADRYDDALAAIRRLPAEQRILAYRLTLTAYAPRAGVANLYKLLDQILDNTKPSAAVDSLLRDLAGTIGSRGDAEKDNIFGTLAQRYERLRRWAHWSLCELHRSGDVQRLITFVGDYRNGQDVEQVKTWVGEFHETAGNPDKAREAYWLLDDKPTAHLRVAETYYGSRAKKPDLQAGRKELSEIVKRFYSPTVSAEALMRRADLETGPLKDSEASIATLRELVDRFPQAGEYPSRALLQLGQILRRHNRPDEAIAAYEKLIVAYPSSWRMRQAWLEIAGCHEEKKDPQRAIEVFRTVLRKFPHTAEASRAHTILETRYRLPDTGVTDP